MPQRLASATQIKTLKAPNTTKADFANTVDPDETAQFNIIQFDLKGVLKFCRRNFVVCFFGTLRA